MARSHRLMPTTVLVVENEALVRLEVADRLARLGLLVLVASDADEAIVLLDAHPEIDVLFTDIRMPGSMDGVRLAHHVRNRWPPVRIIVASGMIDEHFGISNLRVLFVTTNEKRMRNMIAAVASIARGGQSTMFGFACRPDLGQLVGAPAPDGRLFVEPWLRAGRDDMRLDLANK